MVESTFYEYELIFWDEGTKAEANGVVYGVSYSDAVYSLQEYYGKNSIEKIIIKECEISQVYEIKANDHV